MRRIILSIFISLLIVISSFGQKYTTQYEVQYNITSHLDSLHRKNETKELAFLYTGSHYGVYFSYLKAKRSGFLKPKNRRELGLDTKEYGMIGGINPSLNKAFYKDLQNGEIHTIAEIPLGKKYKFKEPDALDWQVMDSTKTVKGYTAKKATTHFAGRDYIAWFTLEIPIHDGPYVFSGLPGLIVELYDRKDDYHFLLRSIQKLKTEKVFEIPKRDSISKNEFAKLYKIAHKKWPENMIAKDFPSSTNRSQETEKFIIKYRREFKQHTKSQNNPIELN